MSEKLIDIPQIFPTMFDKLGGTPTIISLIVLFQGCFGGMGIKQTPKKLQDAIDYPINRFLFLTAISYTATGDIETALFATGLFVILLHMLRTKEEKEQLDGAYL